VKAEISAMLNGNGASHDSAQAAPPPGAAGIPKARGAAPAKPKAKKR